MDVSVASDKDRQLWDDIVFSSLDGTLFHTWNWLKIMEKHNRKKIFSRQYRGILYPLIVRDGNEIIGLLPVFFYTTRWLKIASSPPFSLETCYLGPVMKKHDGTKTHKKQHQFFEFQKAINDFLKNTLQANYIRIRTSPGTADPRPFIWSGYQVTPEFTHTIDLSDGEKTVWQNFNPTVRRAVKKLENNGVSLAMGSKEDVGFLYNLLLGRQRIEAPKEFVLEIFENFSENINFFIAKKDDIPLTGNITFSYKEKANGWIGTPKTMINGVSPNYLVDWEAMRWACNNNFKTYEIIGASDLTLFPFKSQFNAEIIPFYSMLWESPFARFIQKF